VDPTPAIRFTLPPSNRGLDAASGRTVTPPRRAAKPPERTAGDEARSTALVARWSGLPSRSKDLVDPWPPDRRELRDLSLRDPRLERSREELGDRIVFTLVNSVNLTKSIAVHAQLSRETLALVGHGARV
jgi:hypothetical protein